MRLIQAILSGLLLAIPFLDPAYFLFTWVGFVPLLVAIQGQNYRDVYILGSLTGISFSFIVSYWMVDFLILSKGYKLNDSVLVSGLFWFYSAQLFSLIAVLFEFIKRQTKLHESLIFPIVIVALLALYPMLFNVHLGQSQSHFLIALQTVEIFGVYGLDAVIAIVNIILYRLLVNLLLSGQYFEAIPKKIWCFYTVIICSWFYHGWTLKAEWDAEISGYETVRMGLVQPNETPSLKEQVLYPGYSRTFPPEMAMTQRLADLGAAVVVWPEAKYKAYFNQNRVADAYHHQVEQLDTNLIFQDIESVSDPLNSRTSQYNSAIMISRNGEASDPYHKMRRIAFGEYIPFSDNFPILKQWAESYFGKFFDEMKEGEFHQVFRADISNSLSANKTLNIVPIICYETMFPKFVASAISSAVDTDMIVAVSSDGWFGTTHLPYQHINSSVLRAVENRRPLVHVLNNGPSTVTLPNGEVIFQSEINKAGGYIIDVPYSKETRASFFTRYPYLFIGSIYTLFALLILYSFVSHSRHK